MKRWNWLFLGVLVVAGMVVGGGVIVASTAINRYTSTDAFCTSCHTMATLADDSHFVQSAHRANAEGVRVTCSDCHIPATSWFAETYAHATDGIRDIIAEETHDYSSNPALWNARRIQLAHEVREEMRADNSVTCRHCHVADAIHPTSERGRAAHALMREEKLTCIDCHFNLVHAPVPPTMAFIRGSGLGQPAK